MLRRISDVVDVARGVGADGDRAQAVRHHVGHAAGRRAGGAGACAAGPPAASVNLGTASPIGWPTSMAAWMAAPSATTSSTFTPVRGGLPAISRDVGADHRHPRRAADQRARRRAACQVSPASPRASSVSRRVRSMSGNVIASNSARVSSKPLRWVPSWSVIARRGPLGEGPLGLLAADEDLVERDGVVERVEPRLGGELLGQERGDPVVPVLAPQVVVAGGGQDGDILGRDPRHGHVERAAAQVVDQHRLVGTPGLFRP